jgi:hypothetical protein
MRQTLAIGGSVRGSVGFLLMLLTCFMLACIQLDAAPAQNIELTETKTNHVAQLRLQDASVSLLTSTQDNECTAGPGWWVCFNVTPAQITQLTQSQNARMTQLRIQDLSIPTFSVIMVPNTGEFASSWWWYWGQDAATVGNLLSASPGKRLLSIDPYLTSGGLRFAVVMVPNVGSQDKAWWWYYGYDGPTVQNLTSKNNARLIEVRPYMNGGNKVFAVIMVSNTGADEKSWQWWYGESISFIDDQINKYNLRVTNLGPDPQGNWDAILLQHTNESWYWWYGISSGQIISNILNHGTRLIDISPYLVNGVWEYTTVELDNSEPPQDCEI